ncbi:leupaxin-like isoform X2 [Coccinella septempunctata]|uniref:leupaxin-like isoform X2 n=1 Tax=Coccinella septempunctata TaxID=41139 RepID=UPI001D088C65|nr:leupaxin-like isoform X2 [Coccinella septempunctata]
MKTQTGDLSLDQSFLEIDALLADLQSTIPGSGSLNSSRTSKQSPVGSPASRNESVYSTVSYEKSRALSDSKSPSLGQSTNNYYSPPEPPRKPGAYNNNLMELDNLLQDLSSSRYANLSDHGLNGSQNASFNGSGARSPHSRPSSAQSISNRPTVDSLLDSLDSGEVIYTGPQKVTITVKETKTETGFPGETELISSEVSTSKTPAASKATKELEELMASLSTSKGKQPIASPPEKIYPSKATQSQTSPAPKQNLDHMLGNLQADMSRQGVNTSQKGCCSACDKPIVGQVITALGKTWHPEHFTCNHCSQELGTRNFFEREGKPYCEIDYHNLFSPRCAYCNGPILDKCVTALEKTWHMEHFFCAQCGKQFGEDGFHEREGKPYCREDYFDMFAPKCGACNRPIMDNYISALNSQWHPDCFVCRDCRQPFIGGSFFDHEGQPYCETHYHLKRGSLCAGCHKPISGRCITAMFRKFHPEHFVCAFCLKQLNKGTFKEHTDRPYCHACFDKLFG